LIKNILSPDVAARFFSRALVRFETVHTFLLSSIHIYGNQRYSSSTLDTDSIISSQNALTEKSLSTQETISTVSTATESCSVEQSRNENGSYKLLDKVQFFMAETLQRIAFLNEFTNKNQDAMLYFERALSLFSRNHSRRYKKGLARTLTSMGILHFNLSEFSSAFSCFEEALDLWYLLRLNEDDRVDEVCDLLQWMGNVKREMGNPNDAYAFFSDALYGKIIVKGKTHPDVGLIHQSLGIVHDDMEQFDKALKHYEEALRIRRLTLDNTWDSASITCRDMNILKRENWERDARLAVRSEELAVAETLRCIGNAYQSMGDYINAFAFFCENATIHESHLVDDSSLESKYFFIDDLSVLFSTNAIESEKIMNHDDNTSMPLALRNYYDSLNIALPMGRAILLSLNNLIHGNGDFGVLRNSLEFVDTFELHDKLANILHNSGIINCAIYLSGIKKNCLDGCDDIRSSQLFLPNEHVIESSLETYRFRAKRHLEESIILRRKRLASSVSTSPDGPGDEQIDQTILLLKSFAGKIQQDVAINDEERNHAHIAIAFTLYELGRLFADSVIDKNRHLEQEWGDWSDRSNGDIIGSTGKGGLKGNVKRRKSLTHGNSTIEPKQATVATSLLDESTNHEITLRECSTAIKYFVESRNIMQKCIDLTDATLYDLDDPSVASNNIGKDDAKVERIRRMPGTFEKMLQIMAIMYRKLDMYDKAVECYNEVSILLTRMELSSSHGDNNGILNDAKVTTNMNGECDDINLIQQKEKVASSSHSIGDILFDTGEYSRALESYNEALQLRRLLAKYNNCKELDVASTLCCKGATLLKLRFWDGAVLAYDEALRIRVDYRPDISRTNDTNEMYSGSSLSGRRDIAECYHNIARAYEGKKQLDQSLEYFKKAQRIISGSSFDTDADAADLYHDLGNVVLVKDASASNLESTPPSDEDVSLALTCLALAKDLYKRNFGENAVEVACTLCLLGTIYVKYSEFDKAMNSYEEALRIYRCAPLDQSLSIAKTLNLLGLAHLKRNTGALSQIKQSDHKIAKYFELSIRIFEDKKEDSIEEYADALCNMGSAHSLSDETDLAIVCFEDSLAVYKRIFGNEHIKVAVLLEKIGTCLLRIREMDEAFENFEAALSIRRLNNCDNDLGTANIFFGKGIICCERGNFNESLDEYEEAIRIRRAHLGPDDPEVAQVLNNIGSVFARNREYERALLPWNHAMELYKIAGLTEDNTKVICTSGNIEIAKNLVSISQPKSRQSPIRKFENY